MSKADTGSKPNDSDTQSERSDSSIIATFSFNLLGPRAWSAKEEKLGPLPSSLYQDNDIRRLQDYFEDGQLAPLWLREQFDFPPSEIGRESALSFGWLTLLEHQIGKLPQHLQEFVLRSIETEVLGYYDTKQAPPLREFRRDTFDLGTVSVTIQHGARLFATVKTNLTHTRHVDLVALVLTLSFGSVARALSGDGLGWFMFLTHYALWKWKKVKLPGALVNFGKSTWDFSDLDSMVEEARRGGLILS